ncbi:MAG: phospho-N-acetylmuramoyl-pentapeptide-transferase [Ruminococcaceae bacterium]|nr:phospho-N-acetylmuramoyl-pentapeptide-transferase [Oscillospiraceae bacterium]
MREIAPIVAAIVAFAATALSGFFIIPMLRKLKFGQTILEDGPTWHKDKQGTPTMGGIMMVFGIVVALIVAILVSFLTQGSLIKELANLKALTSLALGLALSVLMGAIGFIDDYIKVVKKRNLGLTARQKTFLQLFVSAAYLLAMFLNGMKTFWLPFLGEFRIDSGLGLIFWPIALFFIYGFTNAVNLTDGVDGLAASVTLVVASAFMLSAGLLENFGYNTLSAAVAGACVGFLVWNAHPAKVFMGDTGSMFLGGAVVGLSFGVGKPIVLIIAGIVYLAEAFSVMLQVAYFKKTKKRIFKMAPLHHHFEMSGWNEEKVVGIFTLVALIGCAAAFALVLFG